MICPVRLKISISIFAVELFFLIENTPLPLGFGYSGNSSHIVHFTDISYCRLKQTGFDGKSQYFNIIAFTICRQNLTELNIYSNPENGIFNFVFRGDKD